MNTSQESQNDLKNTNYSASAASGTNPDRYSSSHTVAEAEQISKQQQF